MPLSLRQLLADPGLGLSLIAGARGLDDRGSVRWAHISEIPDPTPWLEGGEVLLTTGLGVRDDEDLQRRLVRGLDERGCAGIGFGVGVVLDAVPPALVDEAERRCLPLFTVPYEVPFIAVTKRVSRQVFEEHYATLRAAVDLHRAVLAAVLSGAGVGGVLEKVARSLPARGCVLFDYYGTVLAAVSPRDRSPVPTPERLWAAVSGFVNTRDRIGMDLDGCSVDAAAVRLGSQVEAVLVVTGSGELLEHEQLLLEQGVTGVSLELARGLGLREAHRVRVDDLLAEVAEHRIGSQALERQLTRLGVNPRMPYRVLCLREPAGGGESRFSQGSLCTLVEDALSSRGAAPLLGRYDGAVYCLVQPADAGLGETVADALRARGWTSARIGRSRAKDKVDGLEVALREASSAAARAPGDGVTDVASLGLSGLLAGLAVDGSAEAYVAAVLGPVLRHDRDEGGALVDTLRAYLRHGCRPGPAAAEMGVHRHTLAYRLDRVSGLTGRNLRDGSHLLELGLALELQDGAE